VRQGCPLSPLLLNKVLKFLTKNNKKRAMNKKIQIGKEEVKLSLFADNMILYLKDTKISTKNY
jgi:hypothetical protein